MDDAGDEVGEGFADAGAGLEEQRRVVLHRGGDRTGHCLLLRPVLEAQALLQPAALGENFRGEGGRMADRRWGRAGVVANSDHGCG